MKNHTASPNPTLLSCAAAALLSISISGVSAQVSPSGGTFLDKAIITEAGGGEALIQAAAAGGLGPVLVHNFDAASADPSYTITPSADATPSPIGLSFGRHLVVYSTRFDDAVGTNRSELQSNLTLAGAPLAIGRSQGYIRRTGGADETVMSGGAIIDVDTDDDVLTLESFRSDINGTPVPTRFAGGTSIQLVRLDDSWDYLSLERAANQAGTIGIAPVDVTYDTNNSAGTMGAAFSFTADTGDITLNETGLYLVFANTGLEKPNNNTRTNYQQRLTLDDVEVSGSKTTTYLRGNQNAEDANSGVAAIGMIVSATAGQVLKVDVTMESGGSAATIQGGLTGITMVKLPPTAKYIEVTDTTDQNVTAAAETVVSFNTLNSPANTDLTHAGGSAVTVANAGDYLFFSSLFTVSDDASENNLRVIPMHGWQIGGGGGAINRGIGAAYNRDSGGDRTSGSWGATILELAASDTVEMTVENIGTASAAFPNVPAMQGLSLASLVVSNDPAISVNLPITVLPNSTGYVISSDFLDTFDNDTAPAGLTYTVNSVPAGGTLRNGGAALGNGGTFTQADINSNLVTFDAGGVAVVGGFDFAVSDGSASDSSTFVVNVAWPTVTASIAGDGDVPEGGFTDFNITVDVAPAGAPMTVNVVFSGSSTSGADFTGATSVEIADGSTAASINITALLDGLFEGDETITATIDGVTGATITGAIGTPASATLLILDGGNSSPTGTNLTQVVAGTGTLPIADIVVTDPDTGYNSTVNTAGTALFHTNGIANLTGFSDGRPDDDSSFDLDAAGPALSEAAGFSVEIAFIPQAADLTGVVQVWEIGGSSNGSSIVLIDGIPHLVCKANGGAGDQPTDTGDPGFVDLDWATGNQVIVPLTAAPLTAGVPARLAVVFDIVGDTVKSSVNGEAEVITMLTPQSGTNFRGDHTVNTGINAGTGTGGSNNGTGVMGTTAPASINNLANRNTAVSSVRFWNESTGSAAATAGLLDEVTATLTISGWTSAANGTLTTTGGGSFNAGIWSVTGDVAAVNAALAAVEFVTGASTADPTIIAVSLADGDEDGSGPTTGTIIVTAIAADPIYVDDSFAGNVGDPIADADLGAPGNQPATLGLSAFTNLTTALTAVTPSGTIIVNDGDYSGENITLADMVTLQLSNTAGPVRVGDIATGMTNLIDLQGNTLEIGATNLNGAGIDSPIIGAGNLTKVGTGRLIARAVNTYSGTTTVGDGFYRVGFRNADGLQSELAGDGPVVVNAPGRLELNVDVDKSIGQTGVISGTGSVATQGDGTVVFDGAGANPFSGGFELGDGATSSFDGVDQGAKQGFTVVNHSGHLGTGKVLSRGSQLQAGTPGLVIPNDIDITGGGFRCGGTNDFELSGNINPIDNSARGFGNYGLEGCDLTISGNITMSTAAEQVNFEGSNDRDNGTWTITGDISGLSNVLLQNSFDAGVVTLAGNHTFTGTTIVETGTLVLDAAATGGGNLTVNSGATLAGGGSTDSAVVVNGTINPGAGPGTLTTGDLTINGTLVAELDTTTPGTGHDQIVVTGTVTLGGASTLVVAAGPGLSPGALTIIANDAADPVTGAFTGLPEGGALDADALGLNGAVSYSAGDGNDVVIDFSGFTTLGQWRADYYGDSANSGSGADSADAVNGLSNLHSFTCDLDPTVPAGVLDVDAGAGTILSLGPPAIWTDPVTGRIYLRHTRRTDFASIPLTITDEFSRNPGLPFEASAVAPAVIATGTGNSGAAIEAVQTEFPLALPISGGEGRYGRVDVTTP